MLPYLPSNPLCRARLPSCASRSIPEAHSRIVSGSNAAAFACSKSSRRLPTHRKPSPKPSEKSRRGAAIVLLHGTTVGTNTLLQRKGPASPWSPLPDSKTPSRLDARLAPSSTISFLIVSSPSCRPTLRFGANERTDSEGHVLTEPSPAELADLARRVAHGRPEAIAISLLFSFANPSNEDALADAPSNLVCPFPSRTKFFPSFGSTNERAPWSSTRTCNR